MDTGSALATLQAASQWAAAEEALLHREQEALATFQERVGAIETSPRAHVNNNLGAMRTLTTNGTGGESEGLEAVQAAYRETMMAVPHYDAEYGEPFRENVQAELGPDLATALTEAPVLTPGLADQIQVAVRDAIARRSQVAQFLEAERTALSDLQGALEPIHRELEGLDFCDFGRWETHALEEQSDRLLSARERCDALASERQRRRKRLSEADTLPKLSTAEGYLYNTLETDYPGLAALAVMGDRIRSTMENLDIELLNRDYPPGEGLSEPHGNRPTSGHSHAGADTEPSCD